MVLTGVSPINMNSSYTNKNFSNPKVETFDWLTVQTEMKNKLGADIYESWLKKISFEEEINNYVLLSVPTRFIRDWITSRYLDQILKIIKDHKKDIIRIEFKIVEKNNDNISDNQNISPLESKENVSFIKDSYLQYNRIDPNKRFENFITGTRTQSDYYLSGQLKYECIYKNEMKHGMEWWFGEDRNPTKINLFNNGILIISHDLSYVGNE